MRVRCFRLIVGLLIVGVAPAVVCAQESPPVITGLNYEIARNLGASALFGPWASYVAFDPATELAYEGDYVRVTVDIADADLPDGELYARKQSIWWPYGSYMAPEPGPVNGDSEGFRAPPGLQTGTGTATARFEFLIPLWDGPNQARLRGYIDWDVRWVITIEVANAEEPDVDEPVAYANFILYAVENDAFGPANPPPFADAGPDMVVVVGSTAELDGSRTFDAFNIGFDPIDPEVLEKDYLVYVWEWISGPQQVDPIYRDPDRPWAAEVTLNVVGTYTYRLLVEDGINPLPSTDSVNIDVVSLVPENQRPTAVVIAPTTPVIVGALITLDGTASSDPDGDRLNYRWRQTNEVGGDIPAGDFAELFQPLSGLEDPISTWQAVGAGDFYFQLLVDDGELMDASEIVLIEIIPPQSAGYTVQVEGEPEASAPAPDGMNMLLGPAACGGTFVPFVLLPLLMWPLRGRIR